MASFTAKDVKDLREKTGVGMMECKKALVEADGNVEKAIEILREKGMAAASKKSGRIAAEGIVHAIIDNGVGVVIEVNSETDFVAKNDDFKEFVNECALIVAKTNPADVDALLATKSGDVTVDDLLKEKILQIGENLKIRRFVRIEGIVSTYVHAGGNIGVMVEFDTDANSVDGFAAFAKDIALQVAASRPKYMDKSEVPAEEIAKEREILIAQALNEGKPQNIAEKMVEGRINKYYSEVCLLQQPFVKEDKISVQDYISSTAKEFGKNISLKSFVCLEKGEGLEKKEDNFADEVAGMVK